MRYLLLTLIVFSCTSNDKDYVDNNIMVNQGYVYWKDFDVYAKAFSDTIVMVEIDSNRIKSKYIKLPFIDSVELKNYFTKKALVDFVEKDSAQYEYKYCLKSKKLYKVMRFSNRISFLQMDANYSLDADL